MKAKPFKMSPLAVLGVLMSTIDDKTEIIAEKLEVLYPEGYNLAEGLEVVIEVADDVNEVAVLSAHFSTIIGEAEEVDEKSEKLREAIGVIEDHLSEKAADVVNKATDALEAVDSKIRSFLKPTPKKEKKKNKKG